MDVAMARLADLNATGGARGRRRRRRPGSACSASPGADFPADVRALMGRLRRGRRGRAGERPQRRLRAAARRRAGWLGDRRDLRRRGECRRRSARTDGRRGWRRSATCPATGAGGRASGARHSRAAVRARDRRGPATVLERRVPQRLGVRRPIDVARRMYEGTMGDAPARGAGAARLRGRRGRRRGRSRDRGPAGRRAGDDGRRDRPAAARRAPAGRRRADRWRVPRDGRRVLRSDREPACDPPCPTRAIARLRDRPVLGAALIGLDELGVEPRRGGRAAIAAGVPGAGLRG